MLDVALLLVSLYFSFLLYFGRLNAGLFGRWLFIAALLVGIQLPLLFAFGFYRDGKALTREEFFRLVGAAVVAGGIFSGIAMFLPASKATGFQIPWLSSLFTVILSNSEGNPGLNPQGLGSSTVASVPPSGAGFRLS